MPATDQRSHEPAVGQVWRPTQKVNGAARRRITAIGRNGVVWFDRHPKTHRLAGSTPVPRARWDEWVTRKAAVLEGSASGTGMHDSDPAMHGSMHDTTDAHILGVFEAMARAEEPHRLAVLRACEAIGYGRVMQIASDAWRAKDPIGALTVGPCAGGKR